MINCDGWEKLSGGGTKVAAFVKMNYFALKRVYLAKHTRTILHFLAFTKAKPLS
jgi:hypothetical protein